MNCGIDLVELDRFEKMFQRTESSALREIFTTGELEHCEKKKYPLQSLAGRFAAKEAVMKLFARETSLQLIPFHHIEVCVDDYGAPFLHRSATLEELMARYQYQEINLSLTHTASYASAIAVAV